MAKQERTNAKRALTKKMNFIRQALAEKDLESYDEEIKVLKSLFKDFEVKWKIYHDTLTSEDDIDVSEEYFYKEQDNYIKILELVDVSCAQCKSDKKSDCVTKELLGALSMPKVELEVFRGDPMKYHQFIKSFDLNVDNVCNDGNLKLTRLMQYTGGLAKDAINGCLLIGGDKGYQQARSILEKRFGNPHLVTEHVVRELRQGKQVRSPVEVQKLADDINNALLILSNLGMLKEVDSQNTILEIVGRLQPCFRDRWKKLALKSKKNSGYYPDFTKLSSFMSEIAAEVSDPVYGQCTFKKEKGFDKPKPTASFSMSLETADTPGNTKVLPSNKGSNTPNSSNYARAEAPCVLCEETHRLWHCENFKRLSPRDRLDVVLKNKLCHNCLLSTHQTSNCGKQSVCSVKGCGKKHTMYIHIDDKVNVVNSGQTDVTYANVHVNKDVCMPIVAVTVNDTERVYALLDTGSSNSFCSKRLSRKLGIEGKQKAYQLNTLNECTSKVSEVVNFSVLGNTGEKVDMSGVFVIDCVPAKSAQIDLTMYDHLYDLDIPLYNEYQGVDLLIGQDHAEAFLPLEIRKGKTGEPFAVRSILGWYLNGQYSSVLANNRVVSHFVTTVGCRNNVEDEIHKLWKIENEGLEEISLSQEDKSVIELWDRECKLIDGHYELPIPWKDRTDPLPNNYVVAKSRLDSLLKRLIREGLVDRYQMEIDKLLDNGYAEIVPYDEIHTVDRIWYLPHHAVVTDKKPNKLRVVFDCASRYGGRSLNERCKQGPNLINQLLHVLLRFRLHKFAFQADIEAMCNQIRIPGKDRDALRFLWYKDGKISCYRMTSHLFGGVWCSSSSTYALRRTLADCGKVSTLVRHTVEKAFYVDDCLKSVPTKSEVESLIEETPKVLHYGGFKLAKFVINDLDLLQKIPEELRANEVKDLCPEAVGKVLGVQWNIPLDTFFFTVKVEKNNEICRRKMLSIVSSVFDPLGLANPIVLPGKLLFQEATHIKMGWDEPVPSELEKQWNIWIQSLKSLNQIGLEVPRCMKPEGFQDALLELHHFSDASELAYGCCSYLRCINRVGSIHSGLVISKSKVAPLKQCTIPRLELQAAVLAAKIDRVLRDELDVCIDRSYFWVDSEIVLKYIYNDTKRFHVFVGNRVSLIRQLSNPSQWNYISGDINPADVLSRGQTLSKLNQDIWFKGPVFLREHKEKWNILNFSQQLDDNDPEVKTKPVEVISNAANVNTESENSVHKIAQHFSSWSKIKRILAWWLRLVKICHTKVPIQEGLSVDESRQAEVVLIKHAQQQYYADEIERLRNGDPISKSSPLRSLNPYIDQDGLIRVGGRLGELKHEENRPCIISHMSSIATAIVNDVHCRAHVGVEWTHSLVRQKYWIVRARPLIKRFIHKCIMCKKLYGKPCTQIMADLPLERVEPNKPPFTYIGVDVFGPFYVNFGRGKVKRYGCLFTCLVSRAVHMEKLNSMDTESFINALRRFMSRRGCPEKVFSDQGTNFVGAEAELRKEVQHLSKPELEKYAVQQNIEWNFIPPCAPHMGGVWERMIGCIKRVMKGLLTTDVRLTDEILETLFIEAESIINGRPLTKMSDDPRDPSPLTPNHLLLLREGPVLPLGRFAKCDIYRRRWKHVQYLADEFWRKWVKMYLPQLQKRIKWTEIQRNIKTGDLVLVADENTPRNLWPLGLVKEVNFGRDGFVRSVIVRTQSTELVRPITKIILLEGLISS